MSRCLTAFLIIIIFFRQIIFLSANNNDTYINTTNIVYDEVKEIVELSENSKININNTNILVDRGIIDYKNEKVEVFGDFYLYQEINILSGKDLKGDINLNNFTASDVSYIYNDDLKIDSDSAKRTENIIYFYNNFLTPCELDGYFGCPTWSLRIDETKYVVDKDKFVHFDTFLQIADYKLFYLPYFSHYGAKAPRQRGFLTPTLEFEIGGNSGMYAPYYLPIGVNTDIKFTPKFFISDGFNFMNNYNFNTLLNHKMSGGDLTLEIDNIKNSNDTNVNTSAKMSFKQVLDKNKVLSFNGLATNSISTTRSINEEPVKFENIYLKLDNYNLFLKDDYLKTEINTVESFDSTNVSLIPVTPSFKYQNNFYLNEKISNQNEIDLLIIKRNESQSDLPSENNNLKINNYFFHNKKLNNINIYNKLSLISGFSDYKFVNNNNLNSSESFNHLILSSDLHSNLYEKITPRIKLIINQEINNSGGTLNEDSEAITFNYQNSYSDNRFYGTDLKDNTSRLVYGFEKEFFINNKQININSSQSYDIKKNNNYSNKVNQNSNFSDYSFEGNTKINNLFFSIDARLDKNSLNNKELNFILTTNKPFDISLNYHQTSKEAFLEKSNDTEYLGVALKKEINENLIFSYASNIDLKNNFSPYYDSLGLKIYDECSELNIEYSNKRYNDRYNTAPEEIISISFNMDYLGFFGYEQTTDLFFQEPGNFDYGL